jgi:hypothetical protein
MLVRRDDEGASVYRTTTRYRVQVMEAGARMFDELVRLGVGRVSDGQGSLVVVGWTAEHVAEL